MGLGRGQPRYPNPGQECRGPVRAPVFIMLSNDPTGRILVEDPAGSFSRGLLVGFTATDRTRRTCSTSCGEFPARMSGAGRVQALHRFYTRNDQSVVASWMTREDREHAIADNIEYLNRVDRAVGRRRRGARLCRVLAGRRDGLSRGDARGGDRRPASWRWLETSHRAQDRAGRARRGHTC